MITAITTQRNAVQTLADRVATIISYLQAVRTGTAPLDPETMRQISALVSRLSATDVEELKTEFDTVKPALLVLRRTSADLRRVCAGVRRCVAHDVLVDAH